MPRPCDQSTTSHFPAGNFVEALQSIYREQTGVFGSRANDTRALDRLRSGIPDYARERRPIRRRSIQHGPATAAQLIKARFGVGRSPSIPSWDIWQAAITPNITRLSNGLAAFRRDLGAEMVTHGGGERIWRRVTVSVLGTDHGRGGVMFVGAGRYRGTLLQTGKDWQTKIWSARDLPHDELSRCAPPCPNATRTRR